MSTSIGNTVWIQSADEADTSLEISIPVVLPAGVRTKELTVAIKDSDVLCIKSKDITIVQWRLYSRVSEEVEWRAEQSTVVVDLVKAEGATWPSLLNLPIRLDDPLLTTEAELDAMFRKEVKALPPLNKAAPAPAPAIDEEDLDRLLEETAQEVAEMDVYVKAELKGMEEEETEMAAKLRELEESLSTIDDAEALETTNRQIKLLEKMIEIHHQTRELRSKECTLQLFLETQLLDLRKSRVNIGELSESEGEAYESDEERSLTPHQLLTLGIQYLQEQQLEKAIHHLRLAAVHHKHPQSISILFRIYTELGSPRGAHLLLQRAKDDVDLDITSNLLVAEMFDRGARHFPPIFGAALHFYQRAARCGSVHAMIGIAQLHLRGSTSATTLNEDERSANVNLKKYHAWLEQAVNRGSGAAYFIKGCMYLRGEHGLEKSYAKAKDLLDRSGKCQPEITKRAVGVNAALEKLRIEEDAKNGRSDMSPLTPASPPASPMELAAASRPKADAAARLSALDNQSAGQETKRTAKKTMVSHAAASARARSFWERTAVTSTAVYAVYTLAFPLRVLLLPQFYAIIGWCLDLFGFGGGAIEGGMPGMML